METLVASDPRNVSWNRDLMLAYGHVADVLGNPGLHNLGDRTGALQAYRKAAGIGKTLYEIDRADQRAAADYGIVLSRVETMMDDRDPAAKLAVQQESIRVLEDAAKINPGNVALKIYLALVNQHLGDSYTAAADIGTAHQAYLRSAEIASSGMQSGHASLHILFIHTNQRLALNAVARGRRAEALEFAGDGVACRREPAAGLGAASSAAARPFRDGVDLRGSDAEPVARAERPEGCPVVARQEHGRVARHAVRARLRRAAPTRNAGSGSGAGSRAIASDRSHHAEATMTSQQRQLVRHSFDTVRDLSGPVALLFYGRLFELDPSARRLFHIDLAVQARKIIDTLATVVESLDRFDSIRPRLAELGHQHVGYGVRLEQYDTVSAALIWAIGQALGADFDSATRDAWRLALADVCAAMKEGAEEP